MISANHIRVKRGFNILSPIYDLISFIFFGRSLIASQTYFLPKLRRSKSVLILGGGTGKFLVELMAHEIGESYHYLDISESMIKKSKKMVTKKFPTRINEIIFECGSYENISTRDGYDLIITPYVLDCFSDEETKNAIYLLCTKLTDKGQWLFVDFNISEQSKLSKISSRLMIRFLYSFFNVICGINVNKLPDFSKHFKENDLKIVFEKHFLHGLLVGRVYTKAGN